MENRLKAVEERLTQHEENTASVLQELRNGVNQLNATVDTQLTNLITALTGVNKVDLSTFNKVVGIFGTVILGLVLILGFILTGQSLGILPIR